jgi:hypothetical protein
MWKSTPKHVFSHPCRYSASTVLRIPYRSNCLSLLPSALDPTPWPFEKRQQSIIPSLLIKYHQLLLKKTISQRSSILAQSSSLCAGTQRSQTCSILTLSLSNSSFVMDIQERLLSTCGPFPSPIERKNMRKFGS